MSTKETLAFSEINTLKDLEINPSGSWYEIQVPEEFIVKTIRSPKKEGTKIDGPVAYKLDVLDAKVAKALVAANIEESIIRGTVRDGIPIDLRFPEGYSPNFELQEMNTIIKLKGLKLVPKWKQGIHGGSYEQLRINADSMSEVTTLNTLLKIQQNKNKDK